MDRTFRQVPRISAVLSDDGKAGWERFAAEHGVTVTALIEAIGLHAVGGVLTSATTDELVRKARVIDYDRRHGGGPER